MASEKDQNKQDDFSSLSRSAMRKQEELKKKESHKPLTRLEISRQRMEEERENSKLYQFANKAEQIKDNLFKQKNTVKQRKTIVKPTDNPAKQPPKVKPSEYDPNKIDHRVGIITSPKKDKLHFSDGQKKTFFLAGLAIIGVFAIYAAVFNNSSNNSADKSTKIETVSSADYAKNNPASHKKSDDDTKASKSATTKKHHHKHKSESSSASDNYYNDSDTNDDDTTGDSDNYTTNGGGSSSNGSTSSHHSRSYYSNNNDSDNQATYTIPDRSNNGSSNSSHSTKSGQNFSNVNDALEYGRSHINGTSGNSNFHVSNGSNGGYQVTFY